MAKIMKYVALRLDEDLFDRLTAYCDEHQSRRNISEIIRLAIIQFLDSNQNHK